VERQSSKVAIRANNQKVARVSCVNTRSCHQTAFSQLTPVQYIDLCRHDRTFLGPRPPPFLSKPISVVFSFMWLGPVMLYSLDGSVFHKWRREANVCGGILFLRRLELSAAHSPPGPPKWKQGGEDVNHAVTAVQRRLGTAVVGASHLPLAGPGGSGWREVKCFLPPCCLGARSLALPQTRRQPAAGGRS